MLILILHRGEVLVHYNMLTLILHRGEVLVHYNMLILIIVRRGSGPLTCCCRPAPRTGWWFLGGQQKAVGGRFCPLEGGPAGSWPSWHTRLGGWRGRGKHNGFRQLSMGLSINESMYSCIIYTAMYLSIHPSTL